MNRELWTQSLSKTSCPPWPCPVCCKGTIPLVEKSLSSKQTIESKRARHDESWDPTWLAFTFTAWGQCTNSSCKQDFAIAGTGGVEPEIGPEGESWEEYFTPKICYPMPAIFVIPEKCPDGIAVELRSAFQIFWLNQLACAGRIRVAVECLMDHVGVPKRKKAKSGKFYDLKLHARIDLFAHNEPTMGPS